MVRIPERTAELDGVRGMAILSVMVFHFVQPPLHSSGFQALVHRIASFGWVGVDLFFVLSGFLITGILVDAKGARNYFAVFYGRRVLRILPLYYLVLVAFLFVLPAAASAFGFWWTRIPAKEQWWYWLHISNLRSAFYPRLHGELNTLWSLAIEEQFYLVWPMVVLMCSRRRLFQVCVAVIAGCAAARNLPWAQALNVQYDNFLIRLTPFRIDALAFGALAALVIREERVAYAVRRRLWMPFALGVAVIAAILPISTRGSAEPMTRFGYTAIGLTFASFVLYAAWNAGGAGIIPHLLRSGMLTRCGKYSYAMYMFHLAVLVHLVPRINVPGYGAIGVLLQAMIAFALTYLLALLSWHCVEKHFLRLKRYFNYAAPREVGALYAEPLPAAD